MQAPGTATPVHDQVAGRLRAGALSQFVPRSPQPDQRPGPVPGCARPAGGRRPPTGSSGRCGACSTCSAPGSTRGSPRWPPPAWPSIAAPTPPACTSAATAGSKTSLPTPAPMPTAWVSSPPLRWPTPRLPQCCAAAAMPTPPRTRSISTSARPGCARRSPCSRGWPPASRSPRCSATASNGGCATPVWPC